PVHLTIIKIPPSQIAVAALIIAVSGSPAQVLFRPKIALVRGAAEDRVRPADVIVQWPVGCSCEYVVCAVLAARGGPIANRGVILTVVVRVHEERLADLALIGYARDRHGLLPGASKCGQQQAGQDGDDGNDHQQLDERERRSTPEPKEKGSFHGWNS